MDGMWHWLPLYLTGFLAARLAAQAGLAEHLAHRSLVVARGRFRSVLLALTLLTTLLSLVVPNVLTVLALLPVLTRLRTRLEHAGAPHLTTPLLLSVIYGANLGGLGSLIGSPANALMLGTLAFYDLPEAGTIDFLNWLLWGAPTALALAALGWVLITATLVRGPTPPLPPTPAPDPAPRRRIAATRLVIAPLLAFLALYTSGLAGLLRDALAASICVIWLTIALLWRAPTRSDHREPLLRLGAILRDLPWRGLLFALAAVALSATLAALGAAELIADALRDTLPADPNPFWLYTAIALVAILATELISNTTTALALFPVAHEVALALDLSPAAAIIAVALASTLAFMSPIATPATGLAFGGLRGASLARMLGTGALMNLLCAVVIGALMTWVLPAYYHFSP